MFALFSKTLDQQRSLYLDDGLKAINETISICVEANVLKDYLQNRTEEVVDIMLTLYSQEQATEMMLASERKASRRDGEIQNTVEMCKEFGRGIPEAVSMLVKKFGLTESASSAIVKQYWDA